MDAAKCGWSKLQLRTLTQAGKPTRINGLTTDVTERKRFEEEVSRAWRSAALADQAKSSFLSAASHDLRQPLQTLRFLQAALEPHLPDGEGRRLVSGIARSLDTMSSILSSLLDVNRLEAGNLRPSKSDFAINEVFDSLTADFARFRCRERVAVALGPFGTRWSVATRECSKQCCAICCRTRCDIRIAGTILLGCRRAGDKIRIEVWDSGIGISQDQLPQYFRSTTRARTALSAAASD